MYCICAHNGDMTEEDLNRELEKGYADMVKVWLAPAYETK